MLTVYTTKTCAYCTMVKKYLTLKKVEYQEVDVSEDNTIRDKLHNMTGMTSVPVVTKEDKFVVGWNPVGLATLIA
jgi:glutaredoxin 3